MRTSIRLAVAALVVFAAVSIYAQQKAPAPADYGKWESLGLGELSPDGKWLAYPVSRTNGDNELRLAGPSSHPAAAFGSEAAFSSDSRWLAYSIGYSDTEQEKMRKAKKPVRHKLGLMDLERGETISFPEVSSFAFSRKGPYLAMRGYAPEKASAAAGDDESAAPPEPAGANLIVRNLATGTDATFGSITAFAWQDKGNLLAMTIGTESKTGNGVQVYDPATGTLRALDSGAATYHGLAWRKDSDDLAALKSRSDSKFEDDAHIILAWKGLATGSGEKHSYDPATDAGFPSGKRIVRFRRPSWSEDGKYVFAGVAEWEKKIEPGKKAEGSGKADGAAENEQAGVEVWHARDVNAMPEQKLRATNDRQRNTLAAWRVDSPRLVLLGSDPKESVSPAKGQTFAVAVNRTPYEKDGMFGRRYADVYRVDLETGARTQVKNRLEYPDGTSPDGRFFLYYQDDQYWVHDLAKGETKSITAGMQASFTNREYDHPVKQKPPYGFAGWTKNGRSVILYDDYDLWEVAPDGSRKTRLTNGAGDQVRHRYVKLDPREDFIDLEKPVYLSLYGRWNKKSGYARLTVKPSGPVVDCLVWLDKNVQRLAKAKDADVYAYEVRAFDDSPDYFVGGPELKDARQVSATNPFQKDYAWGRAELIDYKNSRGDRLQGALFYPAGYEAGKTYPMIVYVYEIVSVQLHQYPALSDRAPYNAGVWTSLGYFVYMPDIVFRPRDPGMSALDCVTAGVKKALETGKVDPKRVGLVGHSWGGYETAFLSTQTDMFAAGVAGAPLTDLVSMFGSVYWNTGVPETGHFEVGQERMEAPLWDDPQSYIRNSPVFSVNKMKTPLLVTFGDKDGAVDWHQGIEMYNMARRAGKDFVLLVYAGENHGLRKKPNQIDYSRRVIEWFGHYLKGEPAADWIVSGKSLLDREKELKQKKAKPASPAASTTNG